MAKYYSGKWVNDPYVHKEIERDKDDFIRTACGLFRVDGQIDVDDDMNPVTCQKCLESDDYKEITKNRI